MTPSNELKKSKARAAEWRAFRATFLYTQGNLAGVLGCSRRTVFGIESGETINPHPDLLRRFRTLKNQHEAGELALKVKRQKGKVETVWAQT